MSAGVVAHTLWTSAAPAMAYRLYAEQFHLSHTATTGIFAIYPVFVVATLVGFGDLSDHIGRRATMLAGLAASLAGALLLASAPSFWFLVAARAVMGIGVGLTAGAVDRRGRRARGRRRDGRPRQARRADHHHGAGRRFAAGLLLGGALIEYAPWPTRLSFWVLAGLLALLLVATSLVPRGIFDRVGAPTGGWRPRLPTVPRGARQPFAVAALAMMTAYSHGVLVLSPGRPGRARSRRLVQRSRQCRGVGLVRDHVGAGRHAGARAAGAPAMMLGALASAAGMGLLAAAGGAP
ncbi:MAG: MFS transporter [Pseudomonadota bacterium]